MVATYPILSLLIILALSLLIIRIGSVALGMTGLSPAISSFQAASAYTGAGFTTNEAEDVVSTPERRKIIKSLIRLGNIGLVSAIASLVLSFSPAEGDNLLTLVYVLGGTGGLILLAHSQSLNRLVTPVIEWFLRNTTDLELRDYTQMLGLRRDYRVAEIDVEEGDWLANETPDSCNLNDEGVLLLAISREEAYIGAPGPDTEIEPGDTVLLYGKEDRLVELSERVAGNEKAHQEAIEEHEEVLEEQERRTSG